MNLIRGNAFSFNPLCPNGVQNQFSPTDNHRLSRAKSTRIDKMILNRKIFDLLSNSLNSFFKEMYGDQFGEFVSGYRGLKGSGKVLLPSPKKKKL